MAKPVRGQTESRQRRAHLTRVKTKHGEQQKQLRSIGPYACTHARVPSFLTLTSMCESEYVSAYRSSLDTLQLAGVQGVLSKAAALLQQSLCARSQGSPDLAHLHLHCPTRHSEHLGWQCAHYTGCPGAVPMSKTASICTGVMHITQLAMVITSMLWHSCFRGFNAGELRLPRQYHSQRGICAWCTCAVGLLAATSTGKVTTQSGGLCLQRQLTGQQQLVSCRVPTKAKVASWKRSWHAWQC